MFNNKQELIELETPPPSPTHIWQDSDSWQGLLEVEKVAGEYQMQSPQKRPRTYSARSRPRKRNHARPSTNAPSEFSEIIIGTASTEVADDVHPLVDLNLMRSPANEPDPLPGYQEYVESVAADIAGIYLLTANLFVVQGWDSRTLTATVCAYS